MGCGGGWDHSLPHHPSLFSGQALLFRHFFTDFFLLFFRNLILGIFFTFFGKSFPCAAQWWVAGEGLDGGCRPPFPGHPDPTPMLPPGRLYQLWSPTDRLTDCRPGVH